MDKILAHLVPEGKPALEDSHVRCLFFGNYMEPDADPKIYNEVNQFRNLLAQNTKYQKSFFYFLFSFLVNSLWKFNI
jgi:dynein heavy chain